MQRINTDKYARTITMKMIQIIHEICYESKIK
jgi:hypothetical protein